MRDVFYRWNKVRTKIKRSHTLLQKDKQYGAAGTIAQKTYVILETLQTFDPVVTQIELFQTD
jgi:hypothetical protein